MEKDRIVLASIEDDGRRRCVDIFRRHDGTFGFEEYVREPEDNLGWRPISHTDTLQFSTRGEAETAARDHVGWL